MKLLKILFIFTIKFLVKAHPEEDPLRLSSFISNTHNHEVNPHSQMFKIAQNHIPNISSVYIPKKKKPELKPIEMNELISFPSKNSVLKIEKTEDESVNHEDQAGYKWNNYKMTKQE